MVALRLDRRLLARLSTSDVLQEVFLEARGTFPLYREEAGSSFYLWLRRIATRKLVDLQRHHLGAQVRDVRREVSIERDLCVHATSESIAAALLASGPSPSSVVQRKEAVEQVETAIAGLDPIDREILALRHFEDLSNEETASLLGIEAPAASKRYVRALQRLRAVLSVAFHES